MRKFVVVAIDGAAASGKTSTSTELAKRYNFMMSSTGLHYRAMAYELLKHNIAAEDFSKNAATAENFVKNMTFDARISGNIATITINGQSFDEEQLRSADINKAVAKYASIPLIRQVLIAFQKKQAEVAKVHGFGGLVMEGRDITSVVFPDADLKFFLDAGLSERISRRAKDNEEDDVVERDSLDRQRTVYTDGIQKIDTGKLPFEAVVSLISREIDKVIGRSN